MGFGDRICLRRDSDELLDAALADIPKRQGTGALQDASRRRVQMQRWKWGRRVARKHAAPTELVRQRSWFYKHVAATRL